MVCPSMFSEEPKPCDIIFTRFGAVAHDQHKHITYMGKEQAYGPFYGSDLMCVVCVLLLMMMMMTMSLFLAWTKWEQMRRRRSSATPWRYGEPCNRVVVVEPLQLNMFGTIMYTSKACENVRALLVLKQARSPVAADMLSGTWILCDAMGSERDPSPLGS